MIEYELEGTRRGNAACMNNLAVRAGKSGNHEKAKRLYIWQLVLVMILP